MIDTQYSVCENKIKIISIFPSRHEEHVKRPLLMKISKKRELMLPKQIKIYITRFKILKLNLIILSGFFMYAILYLKLKIRYTTNMNDVVNEFRM